jgi:hypothetical protein
MHSDIGKLNFNIDTNEGTALLYVSFLITVSDFFWLK